MLVKQADRTPWQGTNLRLQSLLVSIIVEAACLIMGDNWEEPGQNIDTTLMGES